MFNINVKYMLYLLTTFIADVNYFVINKLLSYSRQNFFCLFDFLDYTRGLSCATSHTQEHPHKASFLRAKITPD